MRRSASRVKLRHDLLVGSSGSSPYVISSMFGVPSKRWDYRVGKVLGITRACALVQFKDDSGVWTEKFSLRSGVRVADVGRESGWRISPRDLISAVDPANDSVVTTNTSQKNNLVTLHEEEIKFEKGDSCLVISVVAFNNRNDPRDFFLRAAVKTLVSKEPEGLIEKKGYVPKYKEIPGVVSFSKLYELLYEFSCKQ